MIAFNKFSSVAFGWLWFLFVFMWPLVKWALSLITFYHFMRMFYFWDDPVMNAGLEFFAYFTLLTLLTLLTSKKSKIV